MQRHTQTYSTQSLAVAAALASVGIPFNSEIPFIKSRTTKGETYTFFFTDASACGKYRTGDLMKAWENPAFHEDYPEHPLSFIRCAFANREALLDKTKQDAALVVIEKGGKLAILSENASPELQTKVFAKL